MPTSIHKQGSYSTLILLTWESCLGHTRRSPRYRQNESQDFRESCSNFLTALARVAGFRMCTYSNVPPSCKGPACRRTFPRSTGRGTRSPPPSKSPCAHAALSARPRRGGGVPRSRPSSRKPSASRGCWREPSPVLCNKTACSTGSKAPKGRDGPTPTGILD